MQDQSNQTDLPQVQADNSISPSPALSASPLNTNVASVQMPTVASVPDEAGDIDLIEKEWILKAKEIVAHTADDPYAQQQQISHLKADYVSKRYGREVKRPEE